ncbi:MAG TPA: M67 family metallopeptidase [Vicinamibacteria bacterium]|jgi:proteasome lid subunit RPN8/RPN11
MLIAHDLLETMLAHARKGYPLEVCGVLLGRGEDGGARVERVVPVPNRETASPAVRYQIAPEDLLRVQREGREGGRDIVGYYHSHPDHPARPSETDRRIAAEGLSDGVIHVVVGVAGGRETEATAWVFREATQDFEPESLQVAK